MILDGERNEPQVDAAPAAETLDEDVDLVELRASRAAAEAEQAGGQGGEGNGEKPAAEAPSGKATEENRAAEQPHMIPKGRLDQEIHTRKHFEKEAERLSHENALLKAAQQKPGSPGAAAQPQAPGGTIDERQAAIDAEEDKLAAKFDAGDISFADLNKERRALRAQQVALDEERILARVPRSEPDSEGSLTLQNATARLEQEHPYCAHLTQSQLNQIESMAYEALRAEGVHIGADERSTLILRTRIAEMSDDWGPVFLKGKDPVAAAKSGAAPSPSQAPAPALSPEAKARLAKAGMQAEMPVAADAMTGGVGGVEGITDSMIESMSEAEMENLPKAVRARIMGTA